MFLIEKGEIMSFNSKKGFSLVELLVVIAIILILVALMLPMTLRLEDNVNVMIDINNFRSIYQAMYSYAEDNKGHIPHHQATKELGYYSCWNASTYWQAKLGARTGETWNETRNALVGCVGHSSSGYSAVMDAYRKYVNSSTKYVFNCHSPKAKPSYNGNNYSIRTSNSCGAHGTDGPPGGWIISTHNPKAHIVTGGSFTRRGWEKNWDDTKKDSPFEMVYGGGVYRDPWRHMANQYPRLRLDGAAEAIIFKEEWSGTGIIKGGWYPGQGGDGY